jgi:hypothetical protein
MYGNLHWLEVEFISSETGVNDSRGRTRRLSVDFQEGNRLLNLDEPAVDSNDISITPALHSAKRPRKPSGRTTDRYSHTPIVS